MTAEIELFEDLEALGRDAGGGLGREAQPSLFARLDWFRLLREHCPPSGTFLGIRAAAGGARTWLLLAISHPFAEAYSAWYSLRVGAIGSRDPALLTAIAATLRDGGLASVDLAPIEDPAPLREGFRKAGWWTFLDEKTGNWVAHTGGMDFDAYWASRPARLRNTAKRKAKAADLTTEIFERFDEAAWADYEAVYRASWKPEEGSFPFLRALAAQEGEAGTLRLGIARKDGEPVAAQLWLVENGEATIHKLAYAEAAKAMSPGTILGMAMFRHAIDRDHVRLIDYGTGDEPYKADWMDERRVLWRLTAFNPRSLRGLAGAARSWASALAARRRSR